MPIPKKSQLVGLDIGSHTIKLAEIDDNKRGLFLKNFGVIRLPQDAIVEGSIKEMEIVSTAIKNLFRNLKIKNKNVTTSISGYSVIVKKIIPKTFTSGNSAVHVKINLTIVIIITPGPRVVAVINS